MTTPVNMKEALEKLEENSYYSKYADKIAKLQKTAPDEFLSRAQHLEKKPSKKKFDGVTEGKFSQLLHPKKPLDVTQQTTNNLSLDKIMKVDLIKDKSEAEIQAIWQEYHLNKNYISAIIPAEKFDEMQARSKDFPIFIFPLPRSQGFEFILCEFENNCIHFTPLLYYQVHKENAPECLTINHYTEFKENKKIVLMRGEYDKNVIDLKEAQCLANQLQMYYVKPSAERLKLLEIFTKTPDEFKHNDLIKQIENLSLE